MTSVLNIEVLRHQLDTRMLGVGDRLLYVPVVDSTNTLAMQLVHWPDRVPARDTPSIHRAPSIHRGATALDSGQTIGEGAVVLTDSQTQGRGRQGRSWVDVAGNNVLSSTLLRPLFPLHLLVMVAALAVVDAIAETCGISPSIKWPNDILFEDLKLAGVLIETSHDENGRMVAIMGIGINVNGRISELVDEFPQQATLCATATTLETICGHPVSRETLIARLLHHIEGDYLALQDEYAEPASTVMERECPVSRWVRERWRSRLSTLGRLIQVQQGNAVVSGIAEDVDGNGELLLRRHSGELVSISWGDVGYPSSEVLIPRDNELRALE